SSNYRRAFLDGNLLFSLQGGTLMFRGATLLGSGLVVLALLAGIGQSGDKKDPPIKGVQLPKYWNKLGLSDDQKTKALKVKATYTAKIDDLDQQIKKLKKERDTELEKILTEEQKKQLRKLLLDKAPKDGEPTKDAVKDKGKDTPKDAIADKGK